MKSIYLNSINVKIKIIIYIIYTVMKYKPTLVTIYNSKLNFVNKHKTEKQNFIINYDFIYIYYSRNYTTNSLIWY